MDPTRLLPPELVEQAREYAEGARTAVEPRVAATVVLLRAGDDRAGGLEVYLLRRHVGMKFAAGMCVFPGGGVDPRDAELDADLWVGPSPEDWAARMECSSEQAVELVCAAVRETFEESGVLFAGTPTEVVADTTGPDWEADRAALEAREISLTQLLRRRGLVLRSDLLTVLSGWTTPVFEPRRYATWFFVATLPEGQVARDVSTESEEVTWLPIRDAIRAVDDREMMMMPPTYATCCEMYAAATPQQAVEHAHDLPFAMITPTVDPATGRLESSDRIAELGAWVGREMEKDESP